MEEGRATRAGDVGDDSIAGESVLVRRDVLCAEVERVTKKSSSLELARSISEKTVLCELMNVPTHGLHYFVHALLPLLQQGDVNEGSIAVRDSVVTCRGTCGIGIRKLEEALDRTSEVASACGVATLMMSNPGKVGALRAYCEAITSRDQMVIITKNTARTVGTPETGEPVFGTNPLAIGLPGTSFAYDASMSTVATNKVRLARKYGRTFPEAVGVSGQNGETADPNEIAAEDGYLLPFSAGPFWFKSFFLGIAIEGMAAFAGGKTGARVGEHKGKRLESEEGLVAIVFDSQASPCFSEYASQVQLMVEDLKEKGLRIPGDFDRDREEIRVLASDWRELTGS